MVLQELIQNVIAGAHIILYTHRYSPLLQLLLLLQSNTLHMTIIYNNANTILLLLLILIIKVSLF